MSLHWKTQWTEIKRQFKNKRKMYKFLWDFSTSQTLLNINKYHGICKKKYKNFFNIHSYRKFFTILYFVRFYFVCSFSLFFYIFVDCGCCVVKSSLFCVFCCVKSPSFSFYISFLFSGSAMFTCEKNRKQNGVKWKE